jgi:pilus assembly protein Flp/PilA
MCSIQAGRADAQGMYKKGGSMTLVDRTFVQLLTGLYALKQREEGQALAEYGLILGLVAVVVIAAVTLIGTNLNTTLNSIANAI